MNRREALQALVAVTAVTRIYKADLKPTDTIVVECEQILSSGAREYIGTKLKEIWPDNKIIVLDGRLKLKVVSS